MIKDSVSLDEVIDFLNELLEVDCLAIQGLIENRQSCNEAMADHPTVQVHAYCACGEEDGCSKCGEFSVGLLGILNGIFGKDEDGWGDIAAVYDENSVLVKFDYTHKVRIKK